VSDKEGTSLTSGRDWGALPLRHGQYEWKMEAEGGLVQGPVEMEPFLGQHMLLNLDLGQYGLLVRDGALKALYLDGCHNLEIGRRSDQIQTNSSLIFLSTEESLDFQWKANTADGFVTGDGIPVIGRCTVKIEKPARFYHRVLRPMNDWSPDHLKEHLKPLVHKAFHDLLTEACETGCDHPGGLQSLLMGLGAHQLDDFLSEHGLYCVSLAAYTAAPPIEDGLDQNTGQSADLLHN
jgi:hypothetical protein